MSQRKRRAGMGTAADRAAAVSGRGRDRADAAPATGLGARTRPAAARRQAILEAALTEFAARGYEAARLDDVAAAAGVAKGTLYLYFKDKQALFEELVLGALTPIMDRIGAARLSPDIKPLDVIEMFFALFQKEVLGTPRKHLLRLIIAEGPRFPSIAEFYYREVVMRGLALMREIAGAAVARGEFATDAAARFPQLIVAPLLLAVIWDGLFSNIAPLEIDGLLRAHRDLISGGGWQP
ncbi:MAG TPA: TetR/AcrR family transcriptional regulator [Hyphomicrobiaceae bacterium]|nr:TetR/AcrR family transcriptional regulator [Hyphomicrobiaceae bacterium]